MAFSLAACGTGDSADAPSTPAGRSTADGVLPPALVAVLARDELSAAGTTLADDAIEPDEVVDLFAKMYDPTAYDSAPTAYPVLIRSSDEASLPPGTVAWMVHVAGVEQDISGPVPESGDPPPEVRARTDMFTFFTPVTGEHLVTVYIGPESTGR